MKNRFYSMQGSRRSIRSVRYSFRFDRYCVRGSWWTALLVQRGSGFDHKNQQAFAPFALKAFNAAAGGAKGVLIIDTEEDLPKGRMGTDTLVL